LQPKAARFILKLGRLTSIQLPKSPIIIIINFVGMAKAKANRAIKGSWEDVIKASVKNNPKPKKKATKKKGNNSI
jgi:hypothetical protein